jgi:hypothetical protein
VIYTVSMPVRRQAIAFARAVACAGAALGAAVSCGLDVTGTGPAPPSIVFPSEAGAADAAVDAAVPGYCEAARASDPTIRFCADFDDSTAQPPYGFTKADSVQSGAFALVASPFEPQGGALQVALLDAPSSRTQRLHQHIADLSTSKSARVVVDFDLVVVETSLQYAAIADIEGQGQNCFAEAHVAVQPDGLHALDTVVPLTLGAPYHVRIAGNLTQGKGSPFDATVDGTSIPPKTLQIGGGCNTAWVGLGAFFTSTEVGHAGVVLDHVVMRVM